MIIIHLGWCTPGGFPRRNRSTPGTGRRLTASLEWAASGCRVVTDLSVEAEIEKATDYAEIMKWPILSTPGLVINDKLVSTGRIPSEGEIVDCLKA